MAAVAVVVDDDQVVGVLVVGVVAEQPVAVGLPENGGSQDLVGRTHGDKPAVEHQHPVAVAGLVEVVRGYNHGPACSGLLAEHLEDAFLAGEVEAGDRLVEQQQLRAAGERLRHEDTLSLATRESADLSREQVADLHPGDGIFNCCPVVGRQPTGER